MTYRPVVGVIRSPCCNLASVVNALAAAGATPQLIERPEQLSSFAIAVLPGVGAFDSLARYLSDAGMDAALRKYVVRGDVKILGICLGMQIWAERSEEGKLSGLGIIPGVVRKIVATDDFRVPHIGWASLNGAANERANARYYFCHSYYYEAPDSSIISGTVSYAPAIPAIVRKAALTGVQFHPEKSGSTGKEFIKEWLRL